MRRKLAWVCLLVSPVVLGGTALCISDRDPITRTNFQKIRKGMTLKEVVSILGKENLCRDYVLELGNEQEFVWQGSNAIITVSCWKNEELARQKQEKSPRRPIDDHYLSFWGDITVVNGFWLDPLTPRNFVEKIKNWLRL